MQEEQRLLPAAVAPKTTNLCFSALSVVNTMVGAGILVLPSATMDMGLLMSNFSLTLVIFVIVGVALLNIISTDLLLIAAQFSGQHSFSDLGFFLLGRPFIFIYGTLISLSFFVFITLYAEIFASSFENIMTSFGVSQPSHLSWYMLGIILLFLGEFLLILKKQIAQIKLASLFSFLAALVFVIFLAALLISGQAEYNPSALQHFILRSPSFPMFAGIASFVTAFSYQPVIYAVYLGISNRSLKRGTAVNILACLITFAFYFSTSVLGLFSYPSSALSGDILSTINLNLPHWYRIIPNIVFLVVMAMHIPVVFLILKESFLIMIDECMRRSTSSKQDSQIQVLTYLSMSPLIYYLCTILIWLCSIGLAIVRIPLKDLVNYLGAFGMAILSFVIPGVFYLLTIKKIQVKGKGSDRCCAWFCIVFGILATLLLIVSNISVTLGL